MLGGTAQRVAKINTFDVAKWFGKSRTHRFFQYKPYVILALCDDPYEALKDGSMQGGGLRFQSERRHVVLVTGSDLASATYEIRVHYLMMRCLSVKDGRLSTHDV